MNRFGLTQISDRPDRARQATGFRDSSLLWNSLPRGMALFLGGFCLLNLLAHLRSANLDANLCWIDVRLLPSVVATALLSLGAGVLLAFALQVPRSKWRRGLTLLVVGSLGIVALLNGAQFYALLASRVVRAGVPIPLSLLVAAALVLIFVCCWRQQGAPTTSTKPMQVLAVALACLVAFPLLQMLCFGKTDYRRQADAAVVLGARVYADGRLSDALADRVRTACQLYRDGFVKRLIFSGGPGDGAIHETEAMKQAAIRWGVKAEDIILDHGGVNTQATVKDTEQIFAQLRAKRVLVVSHFYHLPRIKLAYQREGWEVLTVPARESYLLRQLPYNMLREVAALWVYYLRPMV